MQFWIKHPRSKKPDTMLTLSVIAFVGVLVKFLVNDVQIGNINLGTTDATLIAALLGPTLVAYVTRKMKDGPDGQKEMKE